VKKGAGNFVLGMGIILAPLINFLSDTNLPQLMTVEVIYSSLSLLPFLLGALILSWSASKVVTRIVRIKTGTLFPLICTGFYLQFFYAPLKIVFQDLFGLSMIGYEDVICKTLTLLTLSSIWLVTIVLGLKYSRFITRTFAVFISLFLVLTIIPSLQYFIPEPINGTTKHNESIAAIDTEQLNSYMASSLNVTKSNATTKSYPNIYFVIVDAMMSLKNASSIGIVDQQTELIRLKKLGLNYIENSMSSYSATRLTLASIMQLDYFITPKSGSLIVENDLIFRKIMNAERNKAGTDFNLPIFHVLNNVNTQFVWQGNSWLECFRSNSWSCSSDFPIILDPIKAMFRDYIYWTMPFYSSSIVGVAIQNLRLRLFMNDGRRAMIVFENALDNITSLDQPIFSFVHHLAPHEPYEVTDTCGMISEYFPDKYSGYRANYRCVLKEIKRFLAKVNAIDPTAIVIIQGDHGWEELPPIEFSKKEAVSYRAGIFNAIKAPETCFNRYGIPQTTVNSIRFALNCAYRFNFPFEKNIHYSGLQMGDSKSKHETIWRYKGAANLGN
jgi:hypothetical protein